MSPAPIPKTAPFPEEQIELLNQVVGAASVTQRAWLAGFLAGLDAAEAPQAQPEAPARPAEPLTILYATESGNSEKLASDAAKAARKLGLKPSLVDMADLELSSLASVKRLMVIAATWGEGDAPARAVSTYADLMSDKAPSLEGVSFAVLALGDTAYVEFCAIGKALDQRLEELGGTRIADRVDCDLDFAKPAGDWIGTALKALAPKDEGGRGRVIEVDFATRQATDLGPVEAEVSEHINLNSSRSDKETVHLELSFDGAVPAYKPGDALDLYADNDPATVDAILKATGLEGRRAAQRSPAQSRHHHPVAQEHRDLRRHHRPSLRQGAAGVGWRARVDRRSSAHRSAGVFPDFTHGRATPRRDPAAGAARLFDRVGAQRSR